VLYVEDKSFDTNLAYLKNSGLSNISFTSYNLFISEEEI
jgi:hypothetical protein